MLLTVKSSILNTNTLLIPHAEFLLLAKFQATNEDSRAINFAISQLDG